MLGQDIVMPKFGMVDLVAQFTSCTLNEALELNKDKPKGGKIDV